MTDAHSVMTFEQIAIIGFAAWRLSWMFVKEAGPGSVFAKLRARTTLAGLLNCVHCLSVWWVAVLYIVFQLNPLIVALVAAAGVASVIQHYLGLDLR